MNNQRAYSAFTIKALDDKKRTFSGIATTPTIDRVGDTINPLGATFKNPLVLLRMHNHDTPVGYVTFGKPTTKGIPFDAEIPVIEEEGLLKDRVDMAWGEIKHGLVRAVSIGFRPLKYAYKEDGGIDFQETEIYELSSVTIPANAQAVISQVRSFTGEALSRDDLALLKSYDHSGRRNGPVQLILPKTHDLNGAVQLIRPR